MIPHISTLHYMSCSYMVLQHAASICKHCLLLILPCQMMSNRMDLVAAWKESKIWNPHATPCDSNRQFYDGWSFCMRHETMSGVFLPQNDGLASRALWGRCEMRCENRRCQEHCFCIQCIPCPMWSTLKHWSNLIKTSKLSTAMAKRCQQKRCSVASLRTISSLTKHFQIPVRFSQKSFQPNLSTVVRWTAVTTVTAMATRKAKELAPAGAYSYSETNLDAKMWNLVNIWHGAGSRDTVKGCSTPLPGWSRKGGIECCSYIVLWSLRRKLSICS